MKYNSGILLSLILLLAGLVAGSGTAQSDGNPLKMLQHRAPNGHTPAETPPAAPADATDAAAPATRAGGPERDPFWPVGWYPPFHGQSENEVAQVNQLQRWREALKLLQVTGVSRKPDGEHLAVLKGIGVVQTGDVVAIRYGGQTFRWRITDVLPNGIKTEKITTASKHNNPQGDKETP